MRHSTLNTIYILLLRISVLWRNKKSQTNLNDYPRQVLLRDLREKINTQTNKNSNCTHHLNEDSRHSKIKKKSFHEMLYGRQFLYKDLMNPETVQMIKLLLNFGQFKMAIEEF